MAYDRILGPIVRAMETTRPTRTALRGFRQWRSHRDGSRPRVLCVGFQKTGTSSFGVAMRQLGFSHYGYDRDLQRALQEGDVERCLRCAERFDSLDDLPWSVPTFVEAYRRRFPGAYYVLLERDPASWVRSYQAYYKLQERPEVSLARLEAHNAAITRLLADEPRLLRMNICAGQGYETLCPFLGLADPGVPFAWANRGQA